MNREKVCYNFISSTKENKTMIFLFHWERIIIIFFADSIINNSIDTFTIVFLIFFKIFFSSYLYIHKEKYLHVKNNKIFDSLN